MPSKDSRLGTIQHSQVYFSCKHIPFSRETSWCPRELFQASISPVMGWAAQERMRSLCHPQSWVSLAEPHKAHGVPQHRGSPTLVQALLPLGSSQMWVWWPRDPPRSRHTKHPLSPLLFGNMNGHLFTPNWANLIFISHLGHRTSKQIFLPQTDFLTSWFATICVQRAGLLLPKNGRKRNYTGSCTGI